ncbi:hypothetical protein ABSL23_00460 (plasmid) [Halobacterium sp. NMX12-1]|uniref:Uncharacterized protein n=1 Tax=Halobacterium sp. NMX12-1 TaxID=3166650 RepID=A0AAU8C8N9_9EURY
MSPLSARATQLFVGRSRRRSTRWTGLAVVVTVGWWLASAFQDVLGRTVNTPFEPLGTLFLVVAGIGTVVLPVLHAYRNEGWVVCCLLGAVPGFVWGWNGFHIVGGHLSLSQRILHGALVGSLSGLVLGSVGFLLGIVIAYWRSPA